MLMQNVHCLFWNSYLMAYWPNRCVEIIFNFLPNKIYWFFYVLWWFKIIKEGFFHGTQNLTSRHGRARAAAEMRHVAVGSLSQGEPTALQTQPPGDEKWGLFSSEMGRFRSQMPLLRWEEGRLPTPGHNLESWRLAVRGGSPFGWQRGHTPEFTRF